jgi:DNA-binding LacI/PurR family transcriptional regulator
MRQMILNDFKEGDVFYSERQLFDKLKVSKYTIQQALRALVLEGFLDNQPRRGNFVRHKESLRIVGCFQSSYHEVSGNPDLLALVEACQSRDYLLHVYSLNKNATIEDALRMIRGQPINERIILQSLSAERSFLLYRALERAGYKTVVIGGYFPDDNPGICVGINIERQVELVIEHLAGLGHERMLFIMDEPTVLLTAQARASLIQKILDSGRFPQSRMVSCQVPNWGDAFEITYRKLGGFLRNFPSATAIVSMSAAGTWAALRYCMEHGIKVPAQMSLISFDEIPGNNRLPVPLTSIAFPVRERAESAINLLWDDQKKVCKLTEPNLILRASTAAPRKS